MAEVITETVVLTISRLIKTGEMRGECVVTPDVLSVIEATVEQVLSDQNVVIEVGTGSSSSRISSDV